MTDAAAIAATAQRTLDPRRLGFVLVAVAGGALLIPLNSTMLAVALPGIMAEFGVGAGAVSSLVALYLAAVALAMPISGNLGDRFGHRKIFLIGVCAFAATSLGAALAWSFPLLISARVLQAVSGAAITPSASSLIRLLAPEERRGGSFGLFDMLISTTATLGPFIGGVLVSGFGWRALFLLAVPMAMASALLVVMIVPRGESLRPQASLDLPGFALLSAAIVALLAGLNAVRHGAGWQPWAVAVPVLFAAFAVWELRTAQPAIDLRLLASRSFAAALAAVFGATLILHATMVIVPIFTQQSMGASATVSGLVLLVFFVLGAVTAPLAGRLSDRIGRRTPAVVGSLCMAAALGFLWLWTGRAGLIAVAALLSVLGIGFGLSGSPRHTAALESVPTRNAGMAAGTYFTSRYIGGAIGATLAGLILDSARGISGVAVGFGVLALVACAVALASLGLRGPNRASAGWPR